MKYKGYTGVVNYDDEAEIFHGEVIDLKDIITFQGESVKELQKAFQESIDDYLDFCKKRGELPEKPSSGKLVIRLQPSLHHRLKMKAKSEKTSLNKLISTSLEKAVS